MSFLQHSNATLSVSTGAESNDVPFMAPVEDLSQYCIEELYTYDDSLAIAPASDVDSPALSCASGNGLGHSPWSGSQAESSSGQSLFIADGMACYSTGMEMFNKPLPNALSPAMCYSPCRSLPIFHDPLAYDHQAAAHFEEWTTAHATDGSDDLATLSPIRYQTELDVNMRTDGEDTPLDYRVNALTGFLAISGLKDIQQCSVSSEQLHAPLAEESHAAPAAPLQFATSSPDAFLDADAEGETEVEDSDGSEYFPSPVHTRLPLYSESHTPTARSARASSSRASARRQRALPYTRPPSLESTARLHTLRAAPRRRNAVLSKSARAQYGGAIPPMPADGKCPVCPHIQCSLRQTDFARHFLTHLPRDPDAPLFVCGGLPVAAAREKKDVSGWEVHTYHGHDLVGGCWKTFSRRDAYQRHLRLSKHLGDARGQWMAGNYENRKPSAACISHKSQR